MKKRKLLQAIIAAGAMLVIILDTKTAIGATREGVGLCLRTVIPSLFPFFILSGIINSCLLGQRISVLRPLGKLCKIPKGSESLMVLGYISGYPVGAQLISEAFRQGKLPAQSAKRMLGFCSNAGPAFLFGMLSPLFDNIGIIWLLWGIHIVSGLLVGAMLPADEAYGCKLEPPQPVTFIKSTQSAIRVMAAVCGWVVAFRVVIGFCDRWFLWLLPSEMQVLFSGLLELSNGCELLMRLPSAGMRFVLASVMLSFGGLCVFTQTLSVTEGLGSGFYFPGKVLQTILSFLLSYALQAKLFIGADRVPVWSTGLLILTLSLAVVTYFARQKKVVAFGRKMLYNNIK